MQSEIDIARENVRAAQETWIRSVSRSKKEQRDALKAMRAAQDALAALLK